MSWISSRTNNKNNYNDNIWSETYLLTINPFVPNAPFLYPLKTLTVFWCFQGVEKSALGTNGLTFEKVLPIYLQPLPSICISIKPFFPNAPFLHPLKTSENLTVFWCFQELEKECIESKWVNIYVFLKILQDS